MRCADPAGTLPVFRKPPRRRLVLGSASREWVPAEAFTRRGPFETHVSTTTSHPQAELEARDVVRHLLRRICAAAVSISALFAGHGVMVARQFLKDEIPAGRIEAISRGTKSGPMLRLDTGLDVVFSGDVLLQQVEPVKLVVGDRVEKRRDSFRYVVNGTALTDVRWVLRNWLLPVRVVVPLGAYLVLGTVYVLAYRRTPLGDVWFDADVKRPRRPRTRAGMVVTTFLVWPFAAGLVTAALGCMVGCLTGIHKAVFG